MDIRHLSQIPDKAACYRAQGRNFGRHVRKLHYPKYCSFGEEKMANAIAQAALERAKKLRESKKSTTPAPKKSAKPAAAKSSATKVRNTDVPYAKIAQMYDSGKSAAEISDALHYTEKGKWPYQYTYGILKRLRKGVEVAGKIIKVKPKQSAK